MIRLVKSSIYFDKISEGELLYMDYWSYLFMSEWVDGCMDRWMDKWIHWLKPYGLIYCLSVTRFSGKVLDWQSSWVLGQFLECIIVWALNYNLEFSLCLGLRLDLLLSLGLDLGLNPVLGLGIALRLSKVSYSYPISYLFSLKLTWWRTVFLNKQF